MLHLNHHSSSGSGNDAWLDYGGSLYLAVVSMVVADEREKALIEKRAGRQLAEGRVSSFKFNVQSLKTVGGPDGGTRMDTNRHQ